MDENNIEQTIGFGKNPLNQMSSKSEHILPLDSCNLILRDVKFLLFAVLLTVYWVSSWNFIELICEQIILFIGGGIIISLIFYFIIASCSISMLFLLKQKNLLLQN